MTIQLRILCILGAAATLFAVLNRIRKAKIRIADSIFWVIFSAALLIIAIFPGIAFFFSDLLGFQSPANFVYLVVIAILLVKEFLNTATISALSHRLNTMAQDEAIKESHGQRRF